MSTNDHTLLSELRRSEGKFFRERSNDGEPMTSCVHSSSGHEA